MSRTEDDVRTHSTQRALVSAPSRLARCLHALSNSGCDNSVDNMEQLGANKASGSDLDIVGQRCNQYSQSHQPLRSNSSSSSRRQHLQSHEHNERWHRRSCHKWFGAPITFHGACCHLTAGAERLGQVSSSVRPSEHQMTGNRNVQSVETAAALILVDRHVDETRVVEISPGRCLKVSQPEIGCHVANTSDVTNSGSEETEVPGESLFGDCDNEVDGEVKYFTMLRQRDWNASPIDSQRLDGDVIGVGDRQQCQCVDCRRRRRRVDIRITPRPRLNFRKMQVK